MGSRWERTVYLVGKTILRVAFGFFFRVRAYGQANLPREGGVLLLSNHQSYIDPPLVGIATRRKLRYMARDTLFSNRLFGALLRVVGVFPVKRGRFDRDAIRTTIEQLVAGEAVVMFPEGTRTSDGELQAVKGGFRLLVRRAGAPVMPVALDGPFRAWPRSRLFPLPGQVRIIYGRPIPPEKFEGLSEEQAAARLSREIFLLLEKLQNLP